MKMLKCMRWIMLIVGLSLLTGQPVRANENLPEYYRPVIEDYEKNWTGYWMLISWVLMIVLIFLN